MGDTQHETMPEQQIGIEEYAEEYENLEYYLDTISELNFDEE